MRLKFTGPEGATFAGKDMPALTLDEARLDTVAALQRATGLKMKDIIETANSTEMDGVQMMVFLSLHEAKHMVSWETVQGLQMKHFDTVEEPGDLVDLDEPEVPEVPTSPVTASDQAAAGDTATPAP